MKKENFYRKIIIKADTNDTIISVLSSLDNWKYCGIIDNYGALYYELTNESENAKVLLNGVSSNFVVSTNVLPIETNGNEKIKYNYGYDYSENQAEDIKDDILFKLCKEINQNLPIDENVFCGIIPAVND